jgi:DNA replication protein DnaC
MKARRKMDEELEKMLLALRLDHLRDRWDEQVAAARQGKFPPERLLRQVVREEYEWKQNLARLKRRKQARVPEELEIETFPFQRQPKLDRKLVMSLYESFDYMRKSRDIIWMGPTGCGKTGLATAFLLQAVARGYRGQFVLFRDLVNDLYASLADHSEKRLLKRYASYDCLVIDEVGYVDVEPAQVGLFFTLMHKRHKQKPTLITTNLGFSEWKSFLKNENLTAALVDRLTSNGHVINMRQCKSIRDTRDGPRDDT